MITKDDFKNLIEAQSLERRVSEHLENIKKHEGRILFLKKNRDKRIIDQSSRQSELKSKKELYQSLDKDVYSLDSLLKKAKDKLANAISESQVQASLKEIESIGPELEDKEERALILLELIEEIENELKSDESFLKGQEETINEIQKEVDEDIAKEKKEIENYTNRVISLLSTTDDTLVTAFNNSNKKFKYKNPIAFIEQNRCNQCKIEIPTTTFNIVETGNQLECCGGCGRPFSPTMYF